MDEHDALEADASDTLSDVRIPRLEWRYGAALCLVLSLLLAGWMIKETRTQRTIENASIINEAGRQRMLSQRFLYIAHREDAATVNRREQLSKILDRFEAAHAHLSGLAAHEPDLAMVYSEPGVMPSLDATVASFVALGRQAIARPGDLGILAALREVGEGTLLIQLDAAVAAFERNARADVQNLILIERVTFIATLLTIVIEALFVFLPGHRALMAIIEALGQRNRALRRLAEELRVGRDLLATKSAELEEAADALASSLDESEALRREQSAFTYAVSHDLKSPSNTIAMVLSEIEEVNGATLDEDTRELLGVASAAIRRMDDLIESVLDYGRVANSEMERCWIDLDQLLDAVLSDLGAEIAAAGADVAAEPLGSIWAQPLQTRMLLQNLVSNAVKFREPGNRPIVRLSAARDAATGLAVLRVRDNGISIPVSARERVLQLFKRLHNRKSYEGSGIGLALCDRISRNHGGRIDFEDHDGPGITVLAVFGDQPERTGTTGEVERLEKVA